MIEPIARIRIELQEIEPKVWRRVDVPLSSTLLALHDFIQFAFRCKRTPSPPLRGQAASDRALSGLQFQGSNWSMRLLGCSGMRWSTSVSHACGSRPFILAVSMRV